MPKYHTIERLSEIAIDAIDQEQMFLNRATTQEAHASCAENKSIWLDILEVIDENTSLKNQTETLKSLLRTVEEALRKETELRQQYQELADLSQEHFTHILRVNKIGYANQIAFKSEKAAVDFAKKHDLRGVTLASIQFAEYGKYDDRSIEVPKE